MKTLTEFAAPTLKNAAKVRQELIAAGKTPEELPAAFGEALKLEGDKLTFMLAAIDLVGDKVNDLKRVIIGALNEGEKAPSGAVDKDGKQFVVEYYPSLTAKSGKPGRDDKRGDRGGRGGDRKKGRGGRDDKRGGGGGGGRPPRDGAQRDARGPRPSGDGQPQGDRGPRPARPQREPRPPREPRPERPASAGPIPLPIPRPKPGTGATPTNAAQPMAAAVPAESGGSDSTPASSS